MVIIVLELASHMLLKMLLLVLQVRKDQDAIANRTLKAK